MAGLRKKYRMFQPIAHILFWLASIGLMYLLISVAAHQQILFDTDRCIQALVPNIGFAFGVYINLYFLIPKFLKQKNYIFYFFWLILLLAFSSVLIQLIFMLPFRYMFRSGGPFDSFNTSLYSSYFFATAIYVGVTSFLKFVKDWVVLQDLNFKYEQIERQKLEAELKTLKAQVNPHFLFNSLNNIYSLTLSNSEKAPEMILKLSDLMRHIIYESRENFICLEKEIEFVKNYIALQKIRVSEKAQIEFRISGEIPDKKIAPLLFEPFIDNAFKHGLKNDGEEFIHIYFDFKKSGYLDFVIENSYEKPFIKASHYSGIGLENVKQRLSLLYPADEYSLTVADNGKTFRIELQLKLKN